MCTIYTATTLGNPVISQNLQIGSSGLCAIGLLIYFPNNLFWEYVANDQHVNFDFML